MGMAQNWLPQRPDGSGKLVKSDVDDGFVALMEFDGGALGTVEASRFCPGRKNYNSFEQIWTHWMRSMPYTAGYSLTLMLL